MSRLTSAIRRWARGLDGATAVEFAMIAPLLMVLSVAMLEFGLIMFDYHRYSEATRRGVRLAMINTPITSLTNLSTTAVSCQGTGGGSVTCTGAAVATAATFTTLFADMQAIVPDLTADQVQVSYADSGVTAVTGMVTPVVTVSLTNVTRDFMILNIIPGMPATFTFPTFTSSRVAATLTTS